MKNYSSPSIKTIENFQNYINIKNTESLIFKERQATIDIIKALVERDKESMMDAMVDDIIYHYESMYQHEIGRFLEVNEIFEVIQRTRYFLGYSLIDMSTENPIIEINVDLEIELIGKSIDYDNLQGDGTNPWSENEEEYKTDTLNAEVTATCVCELSPAAGKDFAYLKYKGITNVRPN